MSIVIKTEKAYLGGSFLRKPTYIKALHKYQLPNEYLNGKPFVYALTLGSRHKLCIAGDDTNIQLEVGVYKKEATFQLALSIIRKAGKRLSEINRKIKAVQAAWNGQETFII